MFNLLRNSHIVFRMAVPFNIPTSDIWGFQYLPILVDSCYFLIIIIMTIAIQIGINWQLIVLLIWISLMTNDVDHLFMNLLSISIPSLEKCLINFFAHFKTGLCVSCWKNIYIDTHTLATRSFLHICFANIFTHSVGCLLTFLIIALQHKSF